ncbi:MAG: capsid protein [Actinobacteria bacterium]|nr:capsid protein [Actinomycetota bacterium]
MAAPDFTVSRFGSVNGSGDAEALFLKQWSGEVLTSFHEMNVTDDKHLIRTIASGKSAQFPATGVVTAAYHTPGAYLVGQSVNSNEVVISIDDLLVADVFVDTLDDAMNHFDMRSIYTSEAALALSEQQDRHVLQQGYIAAAASATITGGDAGTEITDADASTNGSSLAGSLFDAAQALDENKVTEMDRFAFVKPAQYYLLVQTTDAINRDWGGSGAYSEGKIFRVAGLNIVKTNNLANGSDISTAPGHGDADARHAVNATNYVALVMQKAAVGTVRLIGLQNEMAYVIQNQGHLIISKYAQGHSALRPECAALIKTS